MKQKYLLLTIILFMCLFLFSTPSLALIPGDFGSAGGGPPDGCVDFEDLMIFAMAYGSTPADANWNPLCDIAGQGSTTPDGVVDFEDLMIFAMHYGECSPPTYTVTYDGNTNTGGTAPTDTSSPYDYGATVTVLANTGSLVKTNYTFDGWNTAADGNGTDQAEGSTFTMGASDVTLYAQWTINTYTVTFNSQGGSTVSSQTVNHGGKATEPTAPIWAGHTFSGWYKELECTNAWDFDTDTVTSDMTLYAKWAAVIDIAEIPGVTKPVTGATPVTTITATAQYTGTVTWSPNNSTFAGTTVYTATITLTAKPGFTLTGVTENFFTVAGATTDTNPADSGVVTAVFPETAAVEIGNSCGGGVVAYILQSGDPGYVANVQHGLIAATADQSTGIQWYNGSYVITCATGTAIGTGQANTTAIVNIQGAGSYAAQLCNDLTVGGYNDWFLPSKDELDKLYINKVLIGGFTDSTYWSSSEDGAGYAWFQSFISGYQYNNDKRHSRRVRAVRAF